MSDPAPRRPPSGGGVGYPTVPLVDGGATLLLKNGDYLRVSVNKDDAALKLGSGLKWNQLVKFERNDLSAYSGQTFYINPAYVVTIT